MGVYIKGIDMPQDGNWRTVRIHPDGSCFVPNWQGDCTLIKGAQAVSVPPHGALMDRDDFFATCSELVDGYKHITDDFVVIPAEEEDE